MYDVYDTIHLLRVRVYPRFAIGKHFFFPDGHGLLDRIYNVTTSFESGSPVGGSHTDEYRDFTNLQRSFSVDDRVPKNGPLLLRIIRNFLHFGDGHTVVGFVFEPVDGPYGAVPVENLSPVPAYYRERHREKNQWPRPAPTAGILKQQQHRWGQR